MLLETTSIEKMVYSLAYEYLGKSGTALLDFIGNLIVAVLILFIGLRISKYIVKICTKIFEKSKMDPMLQSFLISFLKIALKILIFIFAITKLGIAASSIIAVVGSAGLAVGLSLQGALSNIAGGVILLLIKPFQVGDYILEDSSGKEGTVQAIGIMYTRLLSVDNKTIMIPNGSLSAASITNYTYQEKRKIDLRIGVGYHDDIRKVRETLFEVLHQEPALLEDEPIQIFVSDYKDSCIEMGIRYFVKTEDYWPSRWRVLENLKYAFDENGISIPFNQLDVNINQ